MHTFTTLFEFDTVVNAGEGSTHHAVPPRVFAWLETQCLKAHEDSAQWIRLTQRAGRRAIQFTQYVGVIRAPCGYQIEVLPKIAKDTSAESVDRARRWLVQIVQGLFGFRHVQHDEADIQVVRMPLLEVFIQQFLIAVQSVIKGGLRSDYAPRQDHLPQLRGKLLLAPHLRSNLARPDRFFTEHDEFSPDRPENRLLHTALRSILTISRSQENQRLARELCFVFNEVPESRAIEQDIQRIRLDHGMGNYERALDWATLILRGLTPLVGRGNMRAPSLLFPMDALFEAFVEKYLAKQLAPGFYLKAQASSRHLVEHQTAEHQTQRWFRMRPDFLIKDAQHTNRLLLDAKWKILDARKSNAREKYQLSQTDMYQLYAYGQHYLDGVGDMVLIYPKTDMFSQALPVFRFPQTEHLRLWVVPFCLESKRLLLPNALTFSSLFHGDTFKLDNVFAAKNSDTKELRHQSGAVQ